MNRPLAIPMLALSFPLVALGSALVRPQGPTGAPGAQSSLGSCVACHRKTTPGIVNDWMLSRHKAVRVDCSICHGSEHQTAADAHKARIPTIDTCAACHKERADQFRAGKHAHGWTSMKAMPTMHWQPMALTEGMKGCGGCHKIGLKSEEEIRRLRSEGGGFGLASCDACHTRHTFSVAEAREPQACQTCHMGFDHPQWEMYSSSKHGVRHLLKQNKTLHASASAPRCQTCHMPGKNHEVRTAWGFLGLRLPLPEDKEWSRDRATIFQALGALSPDGKPTDRLPVLQSVDLLRTTNASWQKERDRMVAVCSQCHARRFAVAELAKGDEMIRHADKVMAEAIRTVAALYEDGVLPRPKSYGYAYPDILTFHDAPSVIEQKLFVMFLEHRNRTFQGSFHMNPDYALWYGWSEMQRDLTEIKEKATELRRRHDGK